MKKVKCVVTGHGDGPHCDSCGRAMDSLVIKSKKSKYYGMTAAYCWNCK